MDVRAIISGGITTTPYIKKTVQINIKIYINIIIIMKKGLPAHILRAFGKALSRVFFTPL